MSELNAKHIVDVYDSYSFNPYNEAHVYLKSEADNVIAEKDAEIARLKAIRKVHVEAIESMGAGLLQDDDEIHHQKYKRCLAMVQVLEHVCPMTNRKAKWRDKWHKRWLAIAEKFKTNSTKEEVK